MTNVRLREACAMSIALASAGCGGAGLPNGAFAAPSQTAVERGAAGVYQPLGPKDAWTYICNNQFHIVDRVIGTLHVNKRLVYVFSLQVPSSPMKSVYVDQLLANDSGENTWIYGYYMHHKVHTVTSAKIAVQKPVLHAHYDYPAPVRGKISRVFMGFEYTNKTPLGTFWVAPYFESGGTHNYGYSKGRGVMEEDHGPN